MRTKGWEHTTPRPPDGTLCSLCRKPGRDPPVRPGTPQERTKGPQNATAHHSTKRTTNHFANCPDSNRTNPTTINTQHARHRHKQQQRINTMVRSLGRTGSRWQRARQECMINGELNNLPCFLCGEPIDYEFTRQHPRHSMAGSVHHIISLVEGGNPLDPANLTVAHIACNVRQGVAVRVKRATSAGLRNSRRW